MLTITDGDVSAAAILNDLLMLLLVSELVSGVLLLRDTCPSPHAVCTL